VNIFCHSNSAPSVHGEYFKANKFQKISRTKFVGGGSPDTFIKSKILKFPKNSKLNYGLLQHDRDLKFCTDTTLGALSLFPNFQNNSPIQPHLRAISLFLKNQTFCKIDFAPHWGGEVTVTVKNNSVE